MIATLEGAGQSLVRPAAYGIRLATCLAELRAAQALRYEVFNLELREGLESSHVTGLDADRFDPLCDHLIVEHRESGAIVGTYRLQTGNNAAAHLGYYCAQEFEFEVFEPARNEVIELGRACVHQEHRNLTVLGLLWKGIADYARERGGRYLIGCSSVTSQDPAVGARVYSELIRHHLAPSEWQTRPQPEYLCPLNELSDQEVKVPKLLRAYLSLGAKICGAPALDREFRTIDFLTLLDLKAMSSAARLRFFGEA